MKVKYSIYRMVKCGSNQLQRGKDSLKILLDEQHRDIDVLLRVADGQVDQSMFQGSDKGLIVTAGQ